MPHHRPRDYTLKAMSIHNTRADKAHDDLNIEQLSTNHLEGLPTEIKEEPNGRNNEL